MPLETLFIEGNIINIAAKGTQADSGNKNIENQTDCILAVKANQEQLLEEIKAEFNFQNTEAHIYIEYYHGRIETKKCSIIPGI